MVGHEETISEVAGDTLIFYLITPQAEREPRDTGDHFVEEILALSMCEPLLSGSGWVYAVGRTCTYAPW